MSDLSDDACVIGFAHFPSVKSTLSFGGDHAEMEITPRARAALDKLIFKGFVVSCEALDGYPNREHYMGANTVQHIIKDRPHLHPWGQDAAVNCGWKTFTKKPPPNAD